MKDLPISFALPLLLLLLSISTVLLLGCQSSDNQSVSNISHVSVETQLIDSVKNHSMQGASAPKAISTIETPTATNQASSNQVSNIQLSKREQIQQLALTVQHSLATHDFESIAPYIHPTKGVRFSMYAYVQPESDKVFTRKQFIQYLKESRIKFTWGRTDGKGDLYITPLPDYLSDWVKADDFQPSSATLNEFQGSGNSLNNLKERYPNTEFVEFYYPGSKKYDGLDWRSLRLVFEEYQGQYYLLAIINDQWTT